MDTEMMTLAEKLANEYPHQPNTRIVRVLTDCVDEFPNADAAYIEQATRARLGDQKPEASRGTPAE